MPARTPPGTKLGGTGKNELAVYRRRALPPLGGPSPRSTGIAGGPCGGGGWSGAAGGAMSGSELGTVDTSVSISSSGGSGIVLDRGRYTDAPASSWNVSPPIRSAVLR